MYRPSKYCSMKWGLKPIPSITIVFRNVFLLIYEFYHYSTGQFVGGANLGSAQSLIGRMQNVQQT